MRRFIAYVQECIAEHAFVGVRDTVRPTVWDILHGTHIPECPLVPAVGRCSLYSKKKRALNQSWVRKVTLGGPTHPLISPLTAHKQMLRKSPGTGQDAAEHCLQPSRACVTTVNDAAGSLTTTWTWTEYCPACWNYHQTKMAISPDNICGKCCSGSWVSQDFERLDHNVISKDLYRNCFKERKDGE